MSALLLELVSLLLRHRLGRGWWCRPGSIIVLASVIYLVFCRDLQEFI